MSKLGTYLTSWNKGWSIGAEICRGIFFSKSETGFCPTHSCAWRGKGPGKHGITDKNFIITKINSIDSPERTLSSTDTPHEEYLVISGDDKGTQLHGDCLGMYQ